MATVHGPLMSMWASGSVGGAISYGPRGDSFVCMKFPRHAVRATEGQRQVRAAVWYAHDMWRRMGPWYRALWVSWFDKDHRNGFQAFSHILQNRYWAKQGAFVKEYGEPGFPFAGVHDWVVFDVATAWGYVNLADSGGVWSLGDGEFSEKFEHQFEAFEGDGASTYSEHTPASSPDYTDGLFVCADVVTSQVASYAAIVQHTNGASYVGNWILQMTSDPVWSFRSHHGASDYSVSSGPVRNGYAQRVGGLWDKAKVWMYVDGAATEGGAVATAQQTSGDKLNVGVRWRSDTGYSAYWSGWIDNVVVGSGVGTTVFKGAV